MKEADKYIEDVCSGGDPLMPDEVRRHLYHVQRLYEREVSALRQGTKRAPFVAGSVVSIALLAAITATTVLSVQSCDPAAAEPWVQIDEMADEMASKRRFSADFNPGERDQCIQRRRIRDALAGLDAACKPEGD